MYGINWQQLIAGIIMIVATIYYIVVLFKTKEKAEFDYIFSRSSQLTFLFFVLGLAVLIVINIASTKFDVLTSLLDFGALVTLVNAISICIYKYKK